MKDIEIIYRDVGGYDMNYDENKDLCRKSCGDEHNYLWIDKSKNRDQRRHCICNESKNTYTDSTPMTKTYHKLTKMMYSIKNRQDMEKLEELA